MERQIETHKKNREEHSYRNIVQTAGTGANAEKEMGGTGRNAEKEMGGTGRNTEKE